MTWYIQKIACKKHVLKNYDESCGESQQLAFYHCWRLTCNKDSDIHDTTRLSESSDGHLIMTHCVKNVGSFYLTFLSACEF